MQRNNPLARANILDGRAVLAMDFVLAGAEQALNMAAQLTR
jgi:hypothetical protein